MQKLILFLSLFVSIYTIAQSPQFIQNQGQFPENVLFQASIPDGKLYLEANSWTFDFRESVDRHPHIHSQSHSQNHSHSETLNKTETKKGHAYQIHFDGSNKHVDIVASEPLPNYNNYFIGNDPSKWAKKVPIYKSIQYNDFYDNIDLFIDGSAEEFKYNFVVKPQGNPDQINMRFEGVDDVRIENNHLFVKTSINESIKLPPYCYQMIDGKRKEVACEYQLEQSENRKNLKYHFPNGYDTQYDLIIDPFVVFSTYSGSHADNWGFTATYDDARNMYSGSIVFDTGYPTVFGSYDLDFNEGRCDMAISKLNSVGHPLYSTYIGGTSTEIPHSLTVNNQNQLVIMGTSGSNNYPISENGFDASFAGGTNYNISGNEPSPYLNYPNGTDIVLSILSEDGSELVGSTYFGGANNDGINSAALQVSSLNFNYGDNFRGDVVVDEADNIYIASCTQSGTIPGTNFLQTTLSGQQDGLIAKFDSGLSQLEWFTYVGGSDDDAIYSLKIHNNGLLYAGGGTSSPNFPSINGLNDAYIGGETDGFLISLSSDGQSFENGTFLGTLEYDQAYLLDIDTEGFVYVLGQTLGTYNIVGEVYGTPNQKQFIHKLTPDLTQTEWATTFGVSNKINISPSAFTVGNNEKIYLSGWGGGINQTFNSNTGSTTNMYTTTNAYKSNTDGHDFYFMVLEKDATSLVYATFFGAESNTAEDHLDGGTSRISKEGILYQAVCAGCGGSDAFPTTPGAWSPTNGSINCNLGLVKFNLSDVDLTDIPIDTSTLPIDTTMLPTDTTETALFELDAPPNTHKNALKVYPNPNNGQFQVFLEDEICSDKMVFVYNLHGQLALKRQMIGNSLDLSDLTKGSYFLLLNCKDKIYTVQTFIH